MHLGAGVGPAVGVSVLRGQGVGLPTVKVPFWPGVRTESPGDQTDPQEEMIGI